MTDRSLRPSDPSFVGGHRLLARLGEGGMGVVYLGRAESGALAAVKVIQAGHGDDEEFRARFRREVRAAQGVDSPWVVKVTGADPEAGQPWLATAFEPGPSLAEAVGRLGPLPPRAVRVLGKLLARALTAVHETGLVHRDVKPGNILLGADGPRLIDFGIARSPHDTALTSTDLVIGTPGFLSPEQAAGGESLSPASDVFSLGCVLAYAATGRLPFGSGAADALLYRTVHDEPDLDGVEPELAAVLLGCLAKDPDDRPTPAELDTALVEDVPSGTANWLPPEVVRMVAERSAQMLALPEIEATLAEPATATGRSRRGFLTAASTGAAVLAVGGGAAAWAALRGTHGGGSGRPAAPGWAIGVQADLSGPGKEVGQAQLQGAQLAVEQFNARRDKPFTLQLRTADDGGSTGHAATAARRLAGDDSVLAVLGSSTDLTTKAALPVYDAALLPVLTMSAGQNLYQNIRSFVRGRPLHNTVAMKLVFLWAATSAASPVGLLMDRSGGDLSWMTIQMANLVVRQYGRATHPRVVPPGTTDLRPVLDEMRSAGIQAFVYAGPLDGAIRAARGLAGFTGPKYAMEPALDARFAAEPTADGWTVLASAIGPGAASVRDFAQAFRTRSGHAPGFWAAEGYDAANLLIGRLTATGGRRPARRDLIAPLQAAKYHGITRTFAFDSKTVGTPMLATPASFVHQVRDGAFDYLGPAPDIALPLRGK
ncbi:bifunctional serine/threonine-protein kinase/ABC transporter substrate-binding protein [Streptomyces camelliae]|uniref:Bifunctional serine/threonine-protein kinase/ABC transporter substrate-binding protein n=1 Tax=Streptomyces camelliae TaxID=3004093 RepID=A0ABY7PI80_9ACTN|nr:bifunctional serine/threonine-protein kinase/ABC transporter substrate-binding protein [Streptomyces sp. HUAS 2-6]WBO68681.1 bifunctional serine/threonine-protein kinase/ABC transporter substrate-binding protein [Streptomyces sp. HUAS 2-6]